MTIPKAAAEVVESAIGEAVSKGKVWLLSGPASLLAEAIPAGVLTLTAKLRIPPASIAAAAILPETLPNAWKGESSSACAIATALSQQAGHTLPWKTVRDVIGGSLQARFIGLDAGSAPWPCEMPAANTVKIKLAESGGVSPMGTVPQWPITTSESQSRVARAVLEPSEVQDLADLIPQLLAIKTEANASLVFRVQIEFGDASNVPTAEQFDQFNDLLKSITPELRLK